MEHIHAGSCPECERDFYLHIDPIDEAKNLGNFEMYHLGERCRLLPSYEDVLNAA